MYLQNHPAVNHKIRILHLLNELTLAGKELQTLRLVKNINPAKYDCKIALMNCTFPLEKLGAEQLPILLLNKKPGNDWRIPFKINRICRNNRIDIVHTHSWGTLIEGVMGAKMAGVPVLVHSEYGTFPSEWKYRLVEKTFWSLTNRLVVVSGDLKKRIWQSIQFPPDRLRIIYNSVDETKFFPSHSLRVQFRRVFGFSQKDFIVGTIGRFHEVKNHEMLLRAAAKLIHNGHDLQVVLVSKGQREQVLRDLSASLGIANRLHFLGFQLDINLIMNGLDVFALTSFSEGCSTVLLEAMFCEKAIVATNVGGNPELIADRYTGLLVGSNDHEQLAQKILFLKKNQDVRSDLGRNARRIAFEKFRLNKMVKAYEELYSYEYKKGLVFGTYNKTD
ncbi:MAG TPA: glycosyltransferase [Caldithrix sp.]|nr:glycosyltransferase [Caldithrix sp.]